MDYNDHIGAIRELASAIVEIAAVDVPKLDVTEDMIVDEAASSAWIDLEQDEEWWDTWLEICNIVSPIQDTVKVERSMRPDDEPHRRREEFLASDDYVALSVSIYADGHVQMLAEYDAGAGFWKTLYDDRIDVSPPDPITIGRQVASAELALLANETGSCANTLDYWQTRRKDGWFTQSRWGQVRNVGRQTINDRVHETKDILNDE